MTTFTPVASLIGGLLIGISAVLLMWTAGRIAGVTGIIAGLLPPRVTAVGVRLGFIAGIIAGPLVVGLVTGHPVQQTITGSSLLFAVSGLLVGFGTVLGNGCTSGHGVCGLSRLSPRSLVATLTFMAVAAGIVFAMRHVVGGGQ